MPRFLRNLIHFGVVLLTLKNNNKKKLLDTNIFAANKQT